MSKGRTDFCVECRKETEYEVRKVTRTETIREKEYQFQFTVAVCKKCGEEMDIPGLTNLNIKERDEQFREAEDLISMEDIRKLMDIYHMGKAPLSLALGFGEITISRYLEGQMPSKNYSDIMRRALSSPEYMEELLIQNREKVGETAYRKAIRSVEELKELFKISDQMLVTIAYIFEQMQEVTPLALQKILYFIQGIYMVLFDKPLYPEDCQAWVHGPVYETVYCLFKDFKYSPIDDTRFVLFSGRSKHLTAGERHVIDLVMKTFGIYSGKVLETITHSEIPWMDARTGYGTDEASNVVILKDDIKSYFAGVSEKYNMESVAGIREYIDSKLKI